MSTTSIEEPIIRVYLLAQNRLVRELVGRAMRKRCGITVIGMSPDCGTEIEQLASTSCDVLLLTSIDSLRLIAESKDGSEQISKIRPVLFGMQEQPEHFLEAVRLGVWGYLLNEASSNELVAAVRAVARGEAVCPAKLCSVLFEQVARTRKVEERVDASIALTCRQRRLMALVAKGMTNKEIATNLNLSEFTVKNHVHRVMAHLRAESRHEAVDVIRAGGLFLNA